MITSRRIYLRIAALGFTTLLTQILLVRETGIWLRGNEIIITAVVASWVVWVALGTAISYICALRVQWVQWGWWLSAWVSALLLIALRCIGMWHGSVAGQTFGTGTGILIAAALACLPCILSGSAFGAALCAHDKKTHHAPVSLLYVCETAGALLAGVLVTVLFLPFVSWWVTVTLLVALCSIDMMTSSRAGVVSVTCGILLAALLLIGVGVTHPLIDTMARHIAARNALGDIVLDTDLPQGRITVIAREGARYFYKDGRFTGSTVEPEMQEEYAAYLTLSAPHTRRVALIGFPYNGVVRLLLSLGWQQIDIIEPLPEALEYITPFLLPEDQKALQDARVRIVPKDPRVHMRRTTQTEDVRYDAVFQDSGMPVAYSSARMYTAEWYAEVRDALHEGGRVMVVLPGSPGYVPDTLAQLLMRVKSALAAVFPGTHFIPGTATYLIGTRDEETCVTQWLMPDDSLPFADALRYFSLAHIADQMQFFRRDHFEGAFADVTDRRVPTDRAPFTYVDALRYEEQHFEGVFYRLLGMMIMAPYGLIMITWSGIVVWGALTTVCLRRHAARLYAWMRMSAISSAGFIAEMTVILRFSSIHGPVFYVIGLLFSACMAGLVTGALVARRYLPTRWHRWCGRSSLVVLCILVYISVYGTWPDTQWLVCVWAALFTFTTGMCVGIAFTLCALPIENVRGGGTSVYSADLTGAVIGGIVVSFLIVPIGGFAAAAHTIPLLLVIPYLCGGYHRVVV